MNDFKHIQAEVARLSVGQTLSLDLNAWCQSGCVIAGFTTESPVQNLRAWAASEGHRTDLDDLRGVLKITRLHDLDKPDYLLFANGSTIEVPKNHENN